MANIPILKPNSTAGAVIHTSSDIAGTTSGGTKKFYLKVVSFVLQASSKPIDITAEGDVALDIRHTQVLHGSLRLIGYMTRDQDIHFDLLRHKDSNKNLTMKLFVGSDQAESPALKYWNFKVVVQNIQTNFMRTAPGIRVVLDALITDKYSSTYVIGETSS